ncbi:MAG: YkgJ family cysteine cluster protein, partial [Myxococcales bacterium]
RERDDGTRVLPLGCAGLSGTCCTLYEARPDGCRVYACQLLQSFTRGKVTADAALATVRTMRAKLDALEPLLPASVTGGSVLQRARRANLPGDGGPLPKDVRAVWWDAEDFLDAHFRG